MKNEHTVEEHGMVDFVKVAGRHGCEKLMMSYGPHHTRLWTP